jgi:hypothetical protein
MKVSSGVWRQWRENGQPVQYLAWRHPAVSMAASIGEKQ